MTQFTNFVNMIYNKNNHFWLYINKNLSHKMTENYGCL